MSNTDRWSLILRVGINIAMGEFTFDDMGSERVKPVVKILS